MHVLNSGPYLGFLYGGIVFVTHGTNLHALVPLSVSLGKELHHDAVCPLSVKLQRFGRVAQVGTVDHVLQNLEERRLVRHTSGCFFPFSDVPCFQNLTNNYLRWR